METQPDPATVTGPELAHFRGESLPEDTLAGIW